MKFLNYCFIIAIFLQFIIILGESPPVLALITNNPFSMSNAKIESVKGITSDGKFLVVSQYDPEQAEKGQITFLRIDMFDNVKNNQTRLRHVDRDLIIVKDNNELFKISSKYGEPLYHVISGTFLASYQFNEAGIYKLSVELVGINFIPINPVFVNFTAIVSSAANENLRINLAS